MKNSLKYLISFWKLTEIGLISKLTLTYTVIIIGFFSGILSVAGFIDYLNSSNKNKPLILFTCLITTLFFIHSLIFLKAVQLKNPLYIVISLLLLYLGYGLFKGILNSIFSISIIGIPYFKLRKEFIKVNQQSSYNC